MVRKKGRIQDVAAAEALAKEGQMSETNEDTGLAVEDTNFAVEDTGLATKDIVPTTGKEFVVPPLDEVRAAPSIGGSVEETIVEASVDPMAGIVEAARAEDFEVLEELGKEGLKVAKSAASSFSGSFRMFATETRDFTKNCFESRAAFVGALLDAKCLQSAVRIQTGYAVSARARFLAHAMKMSALYWSLLGEAFKPIEKVTAKADRAKA